MKLADLSRIRLLRVPGGHRYEPRSGRSPLGRVPRRVPQNVAQSGSPGEGMLHEVVGGQTALSHRRGMARGRGFCTGVSAC